MLGRAKCTDDGGLAVVFGRRSKGGHGLGRQLCTKEGTVFEQLGQIVLVDPGEKLRITARAATRGSGVQGVPISSVSVSVRSRMSMVFLISIRRSPSLVRRRVLCSASGTERSQEERWQTARHRKEWRRSALRCGRISIRPAAGLR